MCGMETLPLLDETKVAAILMKSRSLCLQLKSSLFARLLLASTSTSII